MSQLAQDIAEMIDMLPKEEQSLAYEMVRRLIMAWDPDFSRLTPKEEKDLLAAKASGYVDANAIDWNAVE